MCLESAAVCLESADPGFEPADMCLESAAMCLESGLLCLESAQSPGNLAATRVCGRPSTYYPSGANSGGCP
jgi:hypothetical protein